MRQVLSLFICIMGSFAFADLNESPAPLATPPSLSQNASAREMMRVTKGYSSLFDKGITSLTCDGLTEVRSLNSAKAPFTFKISKAADQDVSSCEISYIPSDDSDIQEIEKFTKLLPDFCKTYKSFYFDSPVLMMKSHPLKMTKLTYQDLTQSSRLVLDKKSQSIQIFHNGTDDLAVEYKKIRHWNLPNRFVFNPDMAGEGAKAITDVKYHVVRGIPTPTIIDSFVHDQRGHSFSSTFTLSNCKLSKNPVQQKSE